MRILTICDIVGRPGRLAIQEFVPTLREEYGIDMVIANGENAAGGFGLTLRTARELFDAGINVITSGNHIWAQKEIIPYLIKSRSDSLIKSIRIWSAGCATGEETYSLAILLHKNLGRDFDRYRISILGTDIDNLSLEKARKGIYRENVLKNIDASMIENYFVKQDGIYQISEQLRSMVRFKRHDMISESCIDHFDLIICRNVMIYFKKEIQEQLQLNFHRALNKKGFFVIGKAETLLGTASNRFKPYNARERLYLKEN